MGVELTTWIDRLDHYAIRLLEAIKEKKDLFVHGNFTLATFLNKNFHLFIILGFCGALIGYMNALVVKDSPVYALNGTLSGEMATLTFLNATLNVQKPLILTPFQQTDLIFGTITAIVLFIVGALAILWEAVNYHDDRPTSKTASEYNLVVRVLFITLFGSLVLVYLSYMIRNYGVFLTGLIEIISLFGAVYVFFITVKKSRNTWRWSVIYMALAIFFMIFNVRLPIMTIFILFLGAISTTYVLLSIPFRALTLILKGLKKKKS